jgi:hypothetical protein
MGIPGKRSALSTSVNCKPDAETTVVEWHCGLVAFVVVQADFSFVVVLPGVFDVVCAVPPLPSAVIPGKLAFDQPVLSRVANRSIHVTPTRTIVPLSQRRNSIRPG